MYKIIGLKSMHSFICSVTPITSLFAVETTCVVVVSQELGWPLSVIVL